jgi:hypothetical protein
VSSVSNLLAHLRPCKITVGFLGVDYTLPALDAVEWVALIDGEIPDLYEIFPVLAGRKAMEAVEDALWEERVTRDEVGQVALDAISAAADRPWWVVLQVLRSAATAWPVVHVNNAVGMSLAGWLDQLWSNIIAHIDPAKRASWEAEVTKAPKSVKPEEIDFDAEEQAFLSAMNAVMR